jgi:hypothetical protein
MQILISGDHGFVTSIRAFDSRPTRQTNMATRRFLLASRRPAWQMALYEVVEGRVTKLADIPGAKEASASMEAEVDQIRVTYTGRADGAPDGSPMDVCEHVVTVPGIWPIDVGAAARLRSLVGILRKQFPQLADLLASFES